MGSPFSALDFGFLYVKDLSDKESGGGVMTGVGQAGSDDNLPCLNFWMLQDEEKQDLIRQVLRPEYLEYTSALIVLDFDQPWEMMNALNRWMGLLQNNIQEIRKQLPFAKQEELRTRAKLHILNYERFANAAAADQDEQK